MGIHELPRALRLCQTFIHDDGSLEKLYNFVINALNNKSKKGNFIKTPRPTCFQTLFDLKNLQITLEDFKFFEILQGYHNAVKGLTEQESQDFCRYASDQMYSHAQKCERMLSEKYVYGVDEKELDSYLGKYFGIIQFYQEILVIDNSELRCAGRIVDITRSLKTGVKGRGKRYDQSGNLIRDWKYLLSDQAIENVSDLEKKYRTMA
jgi:hypothetical protein